MKLFYTLFFLIQCSLTYTQEVEIYYKYKDYDIHVSDSLLVVSNVKTNINDTIFCDNDEEYYLTLKGLKISQEQMLSLESTNPQKYIDINTQVQHFKAYENSSILSIVGPYISFRYEYHYEGGAHPSYGAGFTTYNIETKKSFNLSDFFSDDELFLALIRNDFILKFVDPQKVTNLEELRGEFFMNVDSQYSLDFSSFTFDELISNEVILSICLSHDAEVHRGNFEIISIQLPMPKEIIVLLRKSAKAGLLAKSR